MPTYAPYINLEFVYYKIWSFFLGDFSGNVFVAIYERIAYLAETFVPYALLISLFLLTIIVYCVLRIRQLENELIKSKTKVVSSENVQKVNLRWEKILAYANSDNESDWRLAILEADMILEEMLIAMGYHGESVGEQLQGIEKSDFRYLNEAWEAHKVRNRIAHDGVAYALSKREAKRVISLYEKVFAEFKYI